MIARTAQGVCAIALGLFALGALTGASALASPPTAHQIAIQGVARDLDDALIPSGNVAVRIFADSLGATPLFDSGTLFNGAIVQGIFDVVVGQETSLMLDQEQSYFLELDVAGTEVIGDAAGGRWRFFPNGGSHARTDLEARLTALESAMGLSAASAPARLAARAAVAGGVQQATSAFANVHGLLGLGRAGGTAGGFTSTANLLATPVGIRSAGAVIAQLGPYYLITPTPNPIIRFVHDVPGDQGRSVRVRWRNDQRERPYNPADTQPRITSYALYRRVGPGQAPGQAAAVRAKPEGAEAFALPPGDWDVLTSIPATLDTSYQTVVPTLCDSASTGFCLSTYLVRAITDQPGIYHNSAADSGFSVDNLVPGVPQGLVVQPVSGGSQLSWQASTAPDFQFFRVYRGTDPSFPIGPGSLIQSTTATQYTDLIAGAHTYKVTATDFNGNESFPAIVSTTVGVGQPAPAPTQFALASMVPNPFSHSLTLVVDVPDAFGSVDLSIFDVTGRRVRTLTSGALPASRYTFTWDGRGQDGDRVGPGVYLVRLSGAGRAITRRATLLP